MLGAVVARGGALPLLDPADDIVYLDMTAVVPLTGRLRCLLPPRTIRVTRRRVSTEHQWTRYR